MFYTFEILRALAPSGRLADVLSRVTRKDRNHAIDAIVRDGSHVLDGSFDILALLIDFGDIQLFTNASPQEGRADGGIVDALEQLAVRPKQLDGLRRWRLARDGNHLVGTGLIIDGAVLFPP